MRIRESMPFGVTRLSGEFLDAGIATKAPPKDAVQELVQPAPLVAFYLIGHSIELSLKAFLLGRGVSVTVLKSKRFGHDLSALLVESRRRKLWNLHQALPHGNQGRTLAQRLLLKQRVGVFVQRH